MAERIHTVLDRIETRQGPNPARLQEENVEIGPNDLSIDLLRAVYRNNQLPLTTRMRAAMSCLKHEVPALIATAVVNEQSFAELLDRRLKRISEMKLIEGSAVNGAATITETAIQPEPQRPPPMPAALNRLYNKKLYRRI
jgi:hypothetical protein